MQVVATREGFYGGRIRKPGDRFVLNDKQAFSTRWMVEPGTPEYDVFERALQNQGGRVKQVDQINGERISAGGVAEQLAVAMEDNRELKAKNEALIEELRRLKQVEPKSAAPPPSPAQADSVKDATDRAEKRRRRRLNQKEE